ncbi:MAG TPA: hypothetical protein VII01_08430 [Solirubrobacteraceae bacterium]
MEVATLALRAGTRGGRGSVTRRALCCGVLAFVLTALMAAGAAAKPASYVASDTSLVADYTAVEGAKLGVVLPGGPEHFFEVVESPKVLIPTPIGPALGTTACHDASGFGGGPPVTCVILVAKLPHLNGEIRQTIAHEVFHGFEAVMSGTLANFDSKPTKDWLIEGAATWVESDLIHKDRSARSDWKEYLKTPATLLFSRTYSAIGFFGHLASSGISPWSRFKAMFAAVGSPAAWAAGVGGSAAFLDSEASAFFREGAFGPTWNANGPNVPPNSDVGFHPTSESFATTSPPRVLSAEPYGDRAYALSISPAPPGAPVVEFTVTSGNVRLHSTAGGSVDAVNPTQLLLCSDPKGCSCPTRPNHYERFERGYLAITGGSTGGAVKLVRRRPCEVLLLPLACHVLLPGYTIPIHQHLEPLVGGPLDVTTRRNGTTVSTCALLAKGREVSGFEGESRFVGVLAPFASVLDASSVGGAEKYFRLISGVLPPGYLVTHPEHVGEEAVLFTKATTNAIGELEYGSIMMVRVQNIVAQISLVSTPGDSEADPAQSLKLLTRVARTL